MSDPDEALAKEAKRGSTRAFESLVRRNQSLVRGFLRRLAAGDAALADDLAQETFVMAWRRIGSFEAKGSFKGWLCRIAYTQFLQNRRSAKASQRREDEVMAMAETFQDDRAAAEARLDLDRVMGVLSPEQRAAMALCYGEGMSHAEAAEALGLPLGTVKSHVVRGRAKVLAEFAGAAA
ncbi:MAG: RNA polymerase sigma-70 factor, ECF subfamily [Alphaproteobacteria bacterium]|nr:MAG: RNA polymerase sigma-70 factor ECF subfamily [Caulobacteraceae bacterium]TPW08682.1 MAG: RNA polymerase sigma-70 factor, ECF subfamily [Alphaproteobacteria bacterium]